MNKSDYKIFRFPYSDSEKFRQAHDIRTQVFVKEQNVDPVIEFDGLDPDSTHYLLVYKNKPIATARWRTTLEGIKLERFAVLSEYRREGVGHAILQAILEDVKSKGKKIYLHSQVWISNFYEKNGFRKVGDKFIEAEIDHYRMIYAGNNA